MEKKENSIDVLTPLILKTKYMYYRNKYIFIFLLFYNNLIQFSIQKSSILVMII